MGIEEAKIIDPGSVVTAEWVRLKCQYGCPGFGESLCCPPRSPTPDITRKVIDSYQKESMNGIKHHSFLSYLCTGSFLVTGFLSVFLSRFCHNLVTLDLNIAATIVSSTFGLGFHPCSINSYPFPSLPLFP